MNDLILFYVPVPDEATGLRLTRGALAERLAACGNLHGPVTSLYEWEGEMKQETERVLILKTTPQRADALSAWLEMEHPYDCPCVVRIPVHTNTAFAEWVGTETGTER